MEKRKLFSRNGAGTAGYSHGVKSETTRPTSHEKLIRDGSQS